MTCLGIGVLTLAALVGSLIPGFGAIFPTFTAGIVGLVTAFVTGHAVTDVMALKQPK